MATAYSGEVSIGTYNRIRIKCDYSGTSATLTVQFRRTQAYSGYWGDSQATLRFNGVTKGAGYSRSGTVGTSWVNLVTVSGYSVSTSGGTYSWQFNNPSGVLGCSGSINIPAQGSTPSSLNLSIVDATWNSVTMETVVGDWGTGSNKQRAAYLLEVPYVAGADKYHADSSDTTTDPVEIVVSAATSQFEFSTVPFTVYGCTEYYTGLWASTSVGVTRLQGPTFYTAPYKLNGLTYAGGQLEQGGTVSANLTAVTNLVHNNPSSHIGFEYRVSSDGGSTFGTWVISDVTVAVGGNVTLPVTGLTQSTAYVVEVRQFCTEATSGHFYSETSTVSFTADVFSRLYGSVNGLTKRVTTLYGSVSGNTKKIKKLYGSVNGQTKLIFGEGTAPQPTPEYTMKHYIKSIAAGYIDTGYKVKTTTSVEIEYCLDGTTFADGALLGARIAANNNQFVIWNNCQSSSGPENIQANMTANNYAATYSGSARFKWHTINIATNGNVSIDGRVLGTVTMNSTTGAYNLILLGLQTAGTVDSRLYRGSVARCSFYEDGVLVKNFLPAVRNADNVIGFLETVNNTFYTNQGSGTWTTD